VRDESEGPKLEPHLFFRIEDTPAPDDDGDVPVSDALWNRSLRPESVDVGDDGKNIVRVHKM
jgi:hypothetical protein